MRCILFSVCVLLASQRDTGAQPVWQWIERTFTGPSHWNNPGPRAWFALAFDSYRGRAVLHGGQTGGGCHTLASDGWLWDVAGWVPGGGTAVRLHAAAYDSNRRRTVVFDGVGWDGFWRTCTFPSRTWEFDGTVWTQSAPSASPPARYQYAMAYDAARGRTVLFGGVDQNGAPQSDTWEWDGTVWTSVITNSPGARYGHALAFDAARQRTVLFGGYASTAMPAMQDTWEYDGTTWVPRYDVGFPPGRNGHALTYDSDRRKVVLFGGYTGTANLDDTWEYDGTPWQQVQIAAKPQARHGHGLFYDTVMRQVVVFGGTDGTTYRNDTWALTSYSAPDVTFLGSGHPGASPGQPSGGLWIGSSPAVLGSPLTVRFRNSPSLLPPSPAPAFHLLAIGFPQNPPLPIAGPPGVCAPGVIHAFPQILLQALAPAGQEAVFTIPIPDEPALIGVQEGVQGGSLETPSCFRLTDGIKVRIRR